MQLHQSPAHDADRHDCSGPAADPVSQPPFMRAHEASKSIFLMIALAACGPLAAGVVFFGWRALITVALSVAGCVATE